MDLELINRFREQQRKQKELQLQNNQGPHRDPSKNEFSVTSLEHEWVGADGDVRGQLSMAGGGGVAVSGASSPQRQRATDDALRHLAASGRRSASRNQQILFASSRSPSSSQQPQHNNGYRITRVESSPSRSPSADHNGSLYDYYHYNNTNTNTPSTTAVANAPHLQPQARRSMSSASLRRSASTTKHTANGNANGGGVAYRNLYFSGMRPSISQQSIDGGAGGEPSGNADKRSVSTRGDSVGAAAAAANVMMMMNTSAVSSAASPPLAVNNHQLQPQQHKRVLRKINLNRSPRSFVDTQILTTTPEISDDTSDEGAETDLEEEGPYVRAVAAAGGDPYRQGRNVVASSSMRNGGGGRRPSSSSQMTAAAAVTSVNPISRSDSSATAAAMRDGRGSSLSAPPQAHLRGEGGRYASPPTALNVHTDARPLNNQNFAVTQPLQRDTRPLGDGRPPTHPSSSPSHRVVSGRDAAARGGGGLLPQGIYALSPSPPHHRQGQTENNHHNQHRPPAHSSSPPYPARPIPPTLSSPTDAAEAAAEGEAVLAAILPTLYCSDDVLLETASSVGYGFEEEGEEEEEEEWRCEGEEGEKDAVPHSNAFDDDRGEAGEESLMERIEEEDGDGDNDSFDFIVHDNARNDSIQKRRSPSPPPVANTTTKTTPIPPSGWSTNTSDVKGGNTADHPDKTATDARNEHALDDPSPLLLHQGGVTSGGGRGGRNDSVIISLRRANELLKGHSAADEIPDAKALTASSGLAEKPSPSTPPSSSSVCLSPATTHASPTTHTAPPPLPPPPPANAVSDGVNQAAGDGNAVSKTASTRQMHATDDDAVTTLRDIAASQLLPRHTMVDDHNDNTKKTRGDAADALLPLPSNDGTAPIRLLPTATAAVAVGDPIMLSHSHDSRASHHNPHDQRPPSAVEFAANDDDTDEMMVQVSSAIASRRGSFFSSQQQPQPPHPLSAAHHQVSLSSFANQANVASVAAASRRESLRDLLGRPDETQPPQPSSLVSGMNTSHRATPQPSMPVSVRGREVGGGGAEEPTTANTSAIVDGDHHVSRRPSDVSDLPRLSRAASVLSNSNKRGSISAALPSATDRSNHHAVTAASLSMIKPNSNSDRLGGREGDGKEGRREGVNNGWVPERARLMETDVALRVTKAHGANLSEDDEKDMDGAGVGSALVDDVAWEEELDKMADRLQREHFAKLKALQAARGGGSRRNLRSPMRGFKKDFGGGGGGGTTTDTYSDDSPNDWERYQRDAALSRQRWGEASSHLSDNQPSQPPQPQQQQQHASAAPLSSSFAALPEPASYRGGSGGGGGNGSATIMASSAAAAADRKPSKTASDYAMAAPRSSSSLPSFGREASHLNVSAAEGQYVAHDAVMADTKLSCRRESVKLATTPTPLSRSGVVASSAVGPAAVFAAPFVGISSASRSASSRLFAGLGVRDAEDVAHPDALHSDGNGQQQHERHQHQNSNGAAVSANPSGLMRRSTSAHHSLAVGRGDGGHGAHGGGVAVGGVSGAHHTNVYNFVTPTEALLGGGDNNHSTNDSSRVGSLHDYSAISAASTAAAGERGGLFSPSAPHRGNIGHSSTTFMLPTGLASVVAGKLMGGAGAAASAAAASKGGSSGHGGGGAFVSPRYQGLTCLVCGAAAIGKFCNSCGHVIVNLD